MMLMQQLQYPNGEIAFVRFAQLLRQNGFIIINRMPKNRMRHSLIITKEIDFYCLYRDADTQYGTFEKFNEYFTEFILKNQNYRGHAESINKEILEWITSNYDPLAGKNVVLVYIYKDTKKYVCNPFLFKKFAENNNLIREHKAMDMLRRLGGGFEAINETTYHLPFKKPFFINFDEWVREKV